jgi:hypothetical protein
MSSSWLTLVIKVIADKLEFVADEQWLTIQLTHHEAGSEYGLRQINQVSFATNQIPLRYNCWSNTVPVPVCVAIGDRTLSRCSRCS